MCAGARERKLRCMLTPKVTPIRHSGPSPYAPVAAVRAASGPLAGRRLDG
jgi:hypothetical protein